MQPLQKKKKLKRWEAKEGVGNKERHIDKKKLSALNLYCTKNVLRASQKCARLPKSTRLFQRLSRVESFQQRQGTCLPLTTSGFISPGIISLCADRKALRVFWSCGQRRPMYSSCWQQTWHYPCDASFASMQIAKVKGSWWLPQRFQRILWEDKECFVGLESLQSASGRAMNIDIRVKPRLQRRL